MSLRFAYQRLVFGLACVCAFALHGAGRAEAQQPTAMSAKEIIAACQARARAIDEMRPLQDESERLRQVVVNFGFDKVAAAQEALGAEAARRAHEDQSTLRSVTAADAREGRLSNLAPNRNRDTLVEAMKSALEHKLEVLRTDNEIPADAMAFFKRIAKGDREMERLVDGLNRTTNRLTAYNKLLGHAGNAFTAWDIAYAAADGDAIEVAWKGVGVVAATFGTGYGFLYTEFDWAMRNVYDAVTGYILQHNIEKMSQMTTDNLKLLKQTTEQRARVDNRLGVLRRQLVALPPCDSTQLVRGPEQPPAPPSGSGQPSAVQPPKKGASPAKIAGLAAAGAGIGVGAVVLSDKLAQSIYDTPTSGSGGSGGPGGGSSDGGFSGNYSATATRTCSPGSGASEPCNQAVAFGGCNPLNFTFTVSGGTVRDAACGWLNGTVNSSGSFSGRYTGTASLNLAVSGSFNGSPITIRGSEVYRGNTYNVTLTISKR